MQINAFRPLPHVSTVKFAATPQNSIADEVLDDMLISGSWHSRFAEISKALISMASRRGLPNADLQRQNVRNIIGNLELGCLATRIREAGLYLETACQKK